VTTGGLRIERIGANSDRDEHVRRDYAVLSRGALVQAHQPSDYAIGDNGWQSASAHPLYISTCVSLNDKDAVLVVPGVDTADGNTIVG
jgi:hypothetical protein